MKPSMNVLDKEGKKKYKSKFFTDKGYKTLLNYTSVLAKEYHTRTEYPFKLGIVLGVPMFHFAHYFKSSDELMSRIIGFAQLLGLDEIEFDLGTDSKGKLKWEEKDGN